MKKLTVLFLSLLLAVSLCGCGNNGSDTTNDARNDNAQTQRHGDDRVMDDAKDAADDVVDGAKNAAGDVVDGAKDAADGVADGVKDAVDGAKDAAEELTGNR